MGRAVERLDGFSDAAFAFAATLLVIGGEEAPATTAGLAAAVAEVPAFAIGFAIIAMFWFAHLRWRLCRGAGDWLSALLSVLLVFFVLIYVQPLRAMARSLSTYFGGSGARFEGDLGELFLIYGAGFAAMAFAMACLFLEARRNPDATPETAAAARGETVVWLIVGSTGVVSAILASFEATKMFAPWLYATLPVTIGLFTARFDWTGGGSVTAATPTPQ